MNTLRIFSAAALAGLVVAGLAAPARAGLFGSKVHLTIDRDFDVSGASSIEVNDVSGDMDFSDGRSRLQAGRPGVPAARVTAGDVHVHGEISASSDALARSVRITGRRRGSTFVIWIDEPHNTGFFSSFNSRYAVLYPAQLPLHVEDVSGDVAVHQPFGALSVNCTSGDVTVSRAHGALDVHSISGDVRASVVRPWSGTSISLTSTSGDIHLTLPRAFDAAIDTHTSSGDVHDNAGTVRDAKAAAVHLRTVSGDVIVN